MINGQNEKVGKKASKKGENRPIFISF